MGLSRALFTSRRTTWETPPDLFRQLDREFCFTLDVCASRRTTKCGLYFTPARDAFTQDWTGRCWMNPPYGRAIGAWLMKARDAARRGATVVCLVPARTDTAWWQDLVMRSSEVRLLRGRLRFVGAAAAAPFPSALVIFRPKAQTTRVVAWNWRCDPTRPERTLPTREVHHVRTRSGKHAGLACRAA